MQIFTQLLNLLSKHPGREVVSHDYSFRKMQYRKQMLEFPYHNWMKIA